jgi:hypothetical protein
MLAEPLDQVDSYLGYDCHGAGDVNGDGYSDIVVGAYGYDMNGATLNTGRIMLWNGSASGIAPTPWVYQTAWAGMMLGEWLGNGDVNGDGYSDVLAGGVGWSGPESQEGGAFLFLG